MSRIILIAILSLGFSVFGVSQVNMKIGYELAYINSAQNKILTEGFNETNKVILAQGKQLPELGFNNGLVIGLSYTWEFNRLSAQWHSSSSRKRAFGETTDPQMSFEESFRYSTSGLGVQYELLFKPLSIGFGIGRDNFKMTSIISGSSNNKTIINDPVTNLRFNVGINLLTTQRVSLLLEPYYTFLLDEVDHGPAYPFLGVEVTDGKTVDRPHYFGIRLIFLNGNQE